MKVEKHFSFKILKYAAGPTPGLKQLTPRFIPAALSSFFVFPAIAVLLPSLRILTFFLVILSLPGCHSSSHDKKQVFYYNEFAGLATLDPAFAKDRSVVWATHQLYNTLVETGNDMQIVPSLAKTWEVSADKLTYKFHLRTDVFFHDNPAFPNGRGRKLTAGDVVYSLKRIMDPKTASSGAWIFNSRVESPAAFSAPDDSTFQLTLAGPFNPILGLLSMQYCSIVPREAVEYYGNNFRNHPCGSGPFRFKYWEEGQALILQKNDHYFEKDSTGRPLPYLDAIKVTFYENRATEFLLFRQGQLDFTNDIDPSFKDEVLSKKGELKKQWQGRIILSKHSYLTTEYLGILVDPNNDAVRQSPLRSVMLRQAINYGFDRRKMMMYLRNSIGTPAESGFIPTGFPCFDSSKVHGYHYDPAKASQLLAEAGYPQGRGLPPIRLLTIDTYADMGSFIAKELEEIGIHVQVETVQKSLLLEETAKSTAPFFRGSWIADYPDAENFLSVFYSKNPAPPNYTRYRNPAFDRLYEQSLNETSDSVKNELYRQMDQLVMNDAPVVPLWYDEVLRLVNPRVIGLSPNALNLLELRKVHIKE